MIVVSILLVLCLTIVIVLIASRAERIKQEREMRKREKEEQKRQKYENKLHKKELKKERKMAQKKGFTDLLNNKHDKLNKDQIEFSKPEKEYDENRNDLDESKFNDKYLFEEDNVSNNVINDLSINEESEEDFIKEIEKQGNKQHFDFDKLNEIKQNNNEEQKNMEIDDRQEIEGIENAYEADTVNNDTDNKPIDDFGILNLNSDEPYTIYNSNDSEEKKQEELPKEDLGFLNFNKNEEDKKDNI